MAPSARTARLLPLGALAVCALVVLLAVPAPIARAAATRAVEPLPLISRGVPAHTNDDCGGAAAAGLANDASYDTQWHACGTPSVLAPIYLAYDLSAVAAAQRGRALVAWYNDPTTVPYDHTHVNRSLCCGGPGNDIPAAYTIDGNAAPGGALPASGWVELARVGGNVYHSRQHAVDLTGLNWVRINVTSSDGWALNLGVRLNLDVHDAHLGLQDDWIFFGDSITEAGLAHNSLSAFGGRGTWAQLVNALDAGYFPAYEDGAIGGTLSEDGAANVDRWLAQFAGHYVAIAYGTNDAGLNVAPDTFYANYARIVDAVLAAGAIPVVPTIPWGCSGSLQANGPALNQQLERLRQAYPAIVRGPDLWAYFQANRGLISGDCVHPTGAGYAALREQWANAAIANVYRQRPSASPLPSPTPAQTAPPTPTPTPILPLPLPGL